MDRKEYLPKEKVDKIELKQNVLRVMCECAENIREYYPLLLV